MTKEQAIEILKQVCAQFKGTLSEHQQIQAALAVITSVSLPEPSGPPTVS